MKHSSLVWLGTEHADRSVSKDGPATYNLIHSVGLPKMARTLVRQYTTAEHNQSDRDLEYQLSQLIIIDTYKYIWSWWILTHIMRLNARCLWCFLRMLPLDYIIANWHWTSQFPVFNLCSDHESLSTRHPGRYSHSSHHLPEGIGERCGPRPAQGRPRSWFWLSHHERHRFGIRLQQRHQTQRHYCNKYSGGSKSRSLVG